MVPLGYLVVSDVYIVRLARPHLEALAFDTGETVELLVGGPRGHARGPIRSTRLIPSRRIFPSPSAAGLRQFRAQTLSRLPSPEEQIRAGRALPLSGKPAGGGPDPDMLALELKQIGARPDFFSASRAGTSESARYRAVVCDGDDQGGGDSLCPDGTIRRRPKKKTCGGRQE